MPEHIRVKANAQQDAIAALFAMRKPCGLTQADVCDQIELALGKRAVVASTISRFELDRHTRKPPMGLEAAAVATLYYTRFGWARIFQTWELRLREGDRVNAPLDALLRGAEQTVKDARPWVVMLRSAPLVDVADSSERRLDLAALESLCQQICIYSARSQGKEQQKHLHAKARDFGAQVMAELKDSISAAPKAEVSDLILAARSALNRGFSEFELDRLHDNRADLPRMRNYARLIATHQMSYVVMQASMWTNDPRLALYFSELVTLAHPGGRHNGYANVRIERPSPNLLETAARLLTLSKKVDGHEHTPIRKWSPTWLAAWFPELEPAVSLVEANERN